MRLAANIERIPIDKIEIGLRRRVKLGNLRSLVKSIEAHGLFHPILVRNGNELVAGQRRLEACRALGWATVPVRRVDGLSDEELRAVELEENTERSALLDYEASKARLAEIRQAEAEARQSDNTVVRSRMKPGSNRAIAEASGESRETVRKLEKHVAVAELYPFMQKPEWKQYNVLEAAEHLEKLPEGDRSDIAALLDQPAIPPKTAIQMISHVASMSPPDRKELFDLAKSDDERDRSIALTRAADLPPPPDPGMTRLLEAERALRIGVKYTRIEGLAPKIESLADQIRKLYEQTRKELE